MAKISYDLPIYSGLSPPAELMYPGVHQYSTRGPINPPSRTSITIVHPSVALALTARVTANPFPQGHMHSTVVIYGTNYDVIKKSFFGYTYTSFETWGLL